MNGFVFLDVEKPRNRNDAAARLLPEIGSPDGFGMD